jgi:hypothetical protein
MCLNQHRLGEARGEMGLRTLDLDASRLLHDPPHATLLFSPQSVAVLGKAAF